MTFYDFNYDTIWKQDSSVNYFCDDTPTTSVVTIHCPGVPKDKISVTFCNQVLRITVNEKETTFTRYGIDTNDITATYQNGELVVTMKKLSQNVVDNPVNVFISS